MVRQLLTLAGKTLSPLVPMMDTRLNDGSRMTVTTPPVTAAHPTSGGTAPAAPPMTMFCGVRRLSQTV